MSYNRRTKPYRRRRCSHIFGMIVCKKIPTAVAACGRIDSPEEIRLIMNLSECTSIFRENSFLKIEVNQKNTQVQSCVYRDHQSIFSAISIRDDYASFTFSWPSTIHIASQWNDQSSLSQILPFLITTFQAHDCHDAGTTLVLHTSMSSAKVAALERLQTLIRQNPPTRLRAILSGNAPVARTYPSQDTLLRYLSLPGSQRFLAAALPNNFVSWIVELSSCFESMLAARHEEDLPLLYTAARFGQAQLCGQDDDTLEHICAVFENELNSSSSRKMAPWDDVSALSSNSKEWTGFRWDESIGFEYMALDGATVSSNGKRKFDYRCSSCKRLGLCVCVFIDFLEQMEGLVRVDYCMSRAVAELTRPGLVDEEEMEGEKARGDCFCGDDEDRRKWTRVFTCTHTFHIECIGSWITQHPQNYGSTTCPMCRAEFKDQAAGWVVTDYMRYIRNCYKDLWWWKERLALEKENENSWMGPMRLDPERDLRAAPYDLLSPLIPTTTVMPVETVSSKVIAVRSYRTNHAGSSVVQEQAT